MTCPGRVTYTPLTSHLKDTGVGSHVIGDGALVGAAALPAGAVDLEFRKFLLIQGGNTQQVPIKPPNRSGHFHRTPLQHVTPQGDAAPHR